MSRPADRQRMGHASLLDGEGGGLLLGTGAVLLAALLLSPVAVVDDNAAALATGLRGIAGLGIALLFRRAAAAGPPARARSMQLFALGAAVWSAGAAVRAVASVLSADGSPPAWLAAGYPLCGVLLTAGALQLSPGRRRLDLARAVADAALLTAAVSLVWWKFFDLELEPSTTTAVTLVRTATDALLLAATSLMWNRSGAATRRITGLLACAAIALFVTDLGYLGRRLGSADAIGSLALGWSVFLGLLGLAALAALDRRPPTAKQERSVRGAALHKSAPLLVVLAVITALAIFDSVDLGEAAGAPFPLAILVALTVSLGARHLLVSYENDALQRELTERAVELAHLADTDDLTGLSHRRLFIARTTQALRDRREDGGQVGLVFVDLDGFKRINDRLGHGVGDRVLQVVAERLRSHAGPTDTVARFGGDEFAVLRERADDDIAAWADGFRRLLAEPLEVDGTRLRVTSSVGLVCADGSYADAERMLGDADLAMYRAKVGGSNQTAHFTLSLREAASDRARRSAELQQAIVDRRIVVQYQPIIDLRDGRMVGAEALVRLVDLERGLLEPGEFLPLAETLGLMPEITAIVLETACSDFAQGRVVREGWWVSVNLDQGATVDPALSGRVATVLRRTGLRAEGLVVEVSEQSLPEPAMRAALQELADTGVRIALDDFGSGWSSFAQLRELPLDMVKLDRDLTAELGSGSAAALFRAVVALAGDLRLTVIAEGIETAAQPRLVREAGCHLGQGYYWGQPTSLELLLQQRSTVHDRHSTWAAPLR